MTDDDLRKLARATPTDFEEELVALLKKVRDAALERCAKEAIRCAEFHRENCPVTCCCADGWHIAARFRMARTQEPLS